MRRNRPEALVAMLFAFALVASACASSDDTTTTNADAGSQDTTTTVEAPPEETTTTAAAEPVLLYSILDENESLGQFFPESRKALEAAALFINENGGFGGTGRPVEIEICVGEVDPNVNAECGREIVDSAAIAAVGSAICTNDTAYPILNEAMVPNIGPLTCLPSTFQSENTFSVNAGIQGAVAIEAAIACKVLGAETVYLNLVNADSILATQPVYDGTLQALGCAPSAKTIEMDRAGADGASAVAQMGGADVVLNLLAPPQPAPVIIAADQQDLEATLVFTPTNMSSVILENTGESAEGVMTARWYAAPDSGAPGYDVYSEYLGRVDGLKHIADEFGTAAWVSVLTLDQAFRDCADCEISRAGALQALNGLSGFDAGGIAPTIDFTITPAHPLTAGCETGQGPCFSRIFSLQGFVGIVEGGVIVTFGDGQPIG